jgi:hypothetical protein
MFPYFCLLYFSFFFDKIFSGTWWWLSVAGIFGFLINIAVFLQIKHTSPLTNNISGTLKVMKNLHQINQE